MIKWLTELDIYWPIISYPISRSQVSTCCFFPRKSPIELLRYSIQRMMVSWWSNKPFILCIFVSVFLSLVLGLWYRPQRPISFLPFLKAVRRMKPSPSHAVYSMVSLPNVYTLFFRCCKPRTDLSEVVFTASACHICSWLFLACFRNFKACRERRLRSFLVGRTLPALERISSCNLLSLKALHFRER